MNIAENYTTSLYEILGEDTQKYTSTSVSGGGGYVSGANGTVYGGTAPVTSTTNYHSDQDIWVRNIETGNERKFEFNSYNIAVRPGHKILCSWSNKSEKLERIINISTGTTYAGDGVYNDWTGAGKVFSGSGGAFWTSFLRLSWWPAIPFFSVLHALFAFFKYFISGTGPYWNEKAPSIKKNGMMLLITDALLFFWAMNIANQWRVSMADWIVYMIVAVIPLTILHMKIIKAEFEVVKAHSDELDAYLGNYISANRSKFSEQ
ncbi:MAG: hypothetical protein GQ547_06865 [Methylophaga sp.]|nr:hypothetical protein [Methylophaga sp.]